MTPILTATEFRNCFACDYQAVTNETHCPRCRKPLHSGQQIRILGGLLAFLGFIIAGIIGGVMVWMNNVIANTGKYGSTLTWNASPEETKLMFAVLALVMAFGLGAIIAGGWTALTGKRNLKLLWAMLVLGGVLWFAGSVIVFFQDK